MLTATDIFKSYRTPQETVDVLKGVSLDLAAGETVALMGESGSGKSTLLHVLAGLDVADSGSILVAGHELSSQGDAERARTRRQHMSLIFQQFNLITSLTVADNVTFEAKLAGRFDSTWVQELAERLGLDGLMHRYPEEISGGQQQRVAIARSFAAKPDLILADEPTGNLDEENSENVLDIAFELVAKTGSAFLMATHSDLLARRCGRTLKLTGGQLA